MKRILLAVIISAVIFILIATPCNACNVYKKASNENMKIALTFDDGPHPGRTPEILDILEKYGIKATFFVIGQNVEYYPDIFKRTVEEGHEIGNHTFSHRKLTDMSESSISKEFEAFEKVVSKYCNSKICSVRPPEGSYSKTLEEYASTNKFDIILWSVDTMDWCHKNTDAIVETVLNETESGDIILMHDFISGNSATPDALKTIIPALIERGFKFVTVSELLDK